LAGTSFDATPELTIYSYDERTEKPACFILLWAAGLTGFMLEPDIRLVPPLCRSFYLKLNLLSSSGARMLDYKKGEIQ
jgi:hypothetical protein